MKKIFALLSVLVLLTSVAHAQSRIAVVDLRRVFDNYYKTQLADANLKDEAAELEKERKEMIQEIRKSEEEWKKLVDNANDQAISATERDRNKQAAEKKLLEIRQQRETLEQFELSARAKLGEKHRRKRDAILEEIRSLINTRAKAQSYSLVIDSAAESINNTPIILFSNGENDITESILTELNSSASPSVLKSLEERKAQENK
mgnify:CR=1 FL=1